MQHKTTLELFKVHQSFKVSFTMYLDYIDKSEPNPKFRPMLSKFLYGGNEYLRITPHPFLVIDITSYMDKKEGYGNNTFFTLGRMEIFYFINGLEKLTRVFSDPNIPLYLKDDETDELKINPQLSEKYSVRLRAQGNKVISIIPSVVEHDNIQYEGVCLYINSLDNFSYLTISELFYFLYELRKIDMNYLAMFCILTYHLLDDTCLDKIELPKLPPISEEVKKDEIVDNKKVIHREEHQELPDL